MEIFDSIIAGGGLAGLLTAARGKIKNDEEKILIIEREAMVGGRLRTSIKEYGVWGYGLSTVHEDLFDYWNQTIKLMDPEVADLADTAAGQRQWAAVLAAKELTKVNYADIFAEPGIRALGGGAAWRDWKKTADPLFEALATGKRKHQAFQAAWSGTHKNPSAVVLQHFARLLGLPDVWSSYSFSLMQRMQQFTRYRQTGPWSDVLNFMQESLIKSGVGLQLEAQIIGASFDEGEKIWTVTTRCGQFRCRRLIVAQPPWSALQWLPKNYFPTELLQLAVKAKPVSVVTVTEVIVNGKPHEKLAEVILVPAEDCQILCSPDGEITYQATVDFEMSLQAPDVVKAVRRLKRARHKLHAVVTDLVTEGEHIALLPVGWAQPASLADQKWLEKVGRGKYNSENLAFCGDAYGKNPCGDLNIIRSVQATYSEVDASVDDIPVGEEMDVLDDSADY